MKIAIPFFFCFFLAACGANRNVYKSADFSAKAVRHRTIAVLPFQITQTGYKGKKYDEQSVQEANDKWSLAFQESLHAYLLRATSRNRKGPVTSFQALQKTNALLREASLSVADLYGKKPEEVAQLLGVDAVLMTTIEHEKNFSDGVAYGLAAGRTVLNVLGQGHRGAFISPNASDINMNAYLYDASDSRLLWQTYRKGGTELPTNVDDLVEYYANWIARKFPYKS
ncbi:MAG TPA: hypothetical protein VHK69_11385 [Chitinophagaceae bacterium]|jgi:hypothetical protein|nr:hypothetical protein [Chitinophagaceae bacterium]